MSSALLGTDVSVSRLVRARVLAPRLSGLACRPDLACWLDLGIWPELGVLVGTLDELSVIEALGPLPPGLSSLVLVDSVLASLSTFERYAGTRWCLSLACARACTLSISP
ncbi:hypothetical protein PENFLA_c078G01069 [Penicillium flavigenum]|uniref:Uncharacterized protein n=1 Tax=Penicillium flavigenum TaxID=254877 RepID=A0A1V6SBD5_9EURO|nr:hypothetical protein PENFLA_c078G01069 [Penicillium flavigenum]